MINKASFHSNWNSYILISGPFLNDFGVSCSGKVEIDTGPGESFVNNGTCSFSGSLLLEGEMINTSNVNISGNNGKLTFADNSKLINSGTTVVNNCVMSSQMDPNTILGNFTINNSLLVKASIPEIL